MTMRMLIIAALMLAAGPALAAGGGDSHGGGGGDAAKAGNRYQATWSLADPEEEAAHEEADDSPRLVDMPIIVAPIVIDDELVNYAFVQLRLNVADGHDPWDVRDKAPYLRDAMLRAAHAQPLNDPDDPAGVNPETAARVWIAAADKVLGPGVVADVQITAVDTRHAAHPGGR